MSQRAMDVAHPPTNTYTFIDVNAHTFDTSNNHQLPFFPPNALDHIEHMSRRKKRWNSSIMSDAETQAVHHRCFQSVPFFPLSRVTTRAVGTRPDGHTGRNGSLLSELKGRMSSDFVRSTKRTATKTTWTRTTVDQTPFPCVIRLLWLYGYGNVVQPCQDKRLYRLEYKVDDDEYEEEDAREAKEEKRIIREREATGGVDGEAA